METLKKTYINIKLIIMFKDMNILRLQRPNINQGDLKAREHFVLLVYPLLFSQGKITDTSHKFTKWLICSFYFQ